MNTENKERPVAIVTGASSGIGLGITRALLEHGYCVVGNSRTISKSKELKASTNLVLVDGDIGRKDTAVKVADAAVSHFGRIDLLVNSAGIYFQKPFTEYTPADFEMFIGTNIAGYFFITQQAVAQMRRRKSGHIVSISTSRWRARPFHCPSSPSPPSPPSAAPWRWNTWPTASAPTPSRPASWTPPCTPTTTTSN